MRERISRPHASKIPSCIICWYSKHAPVTPLFGAALSHVGTFWELYNFRKTVVLSIILILYRFIFPAHRPWTSKRRQDILGHSTVFVLPRPKQFEISQTWHFVQVTHVCIVFNTNGFKFVTFKIVNDCFGLGRTNTGVVWLFPTERTRMLFLRLYVAPSYPLSSTDGTMMEALWFHDGKITEK